MITVTGAAEVGKGGTIVGVISRWILRPLKILLRKSGLQLMKQAVFQASGVTLPIDSRLPRANRHE